MSPFTLTGSQPLHAIRTLIEGRGGTRTSFRGQYPAQGLSNMPTAGIWDQTKSLGFTILERPLCHLSWPYPEMLAVRLWSPAKLAAQNWFILTGQAGRLVSSSSSVLIAFFILREHKFSSPSEHASGCMQTRT